MNDLSTKIHEILDKYTPFTNRENMPRVLFEIALLVRWGPLKDGFKPEIVYGGEGSFPHIHLPWMTKEEKESLEARGFYRSSGGKAK